MLSVPMRKRQEKKTEVWAMAVCLVGVIVLAVLIGLIANWSKQYTKELPNNNKTIMELN